MRELCQGRGCGTTNSLGSKKDGQSHERIAGDHSVLYPEWSEGVILDKNVLYYHYFDKIPHISRWKKRGINFD